MEAVKASPVMWAIMACVWSFLQLTKYNSFYGFPIIILSPLDHGAQRSSGDSVRMAGS